MKKPPIVLSCTVLVLLMAGGITSSFAQSTDYVSILQSNPYYYVPCDNTLAYEQNIGNNGWAVVGDQTLWDFTNVFAANVDG